MLTWREKAAVHASKESGVQVVEMAKWERGRSVTVRRSILVWHAWPHACTWFTTTTSIAGG